MRQVFIVAENEDTGEIGLAPKGHSEAFGALGYAPGLAHDLLEHCGQFTVEGECKALGAMYLNRYETGWTSQDGMYHIEPEHIGSEWINLYHGIQQEGCLYDAPHQDMLHDDAEDDLRTIMGQGKRDLLDGIGKEYLDTDIYAQLCKYFAGWFRAGYHEAEKRYSQIAKIRMVDIFNQATDLFQGILDNDIESHIGMVYVAELNLETGHLDISEEEWE